MQINVVKTFLFALAASSVSALAVDTEFRCGAPEPSEELIEASAIMAVAEAEAAANGTLAARQSALTIDTYVHVVATSTSASAGYLSDATIQQQLRVMNEDYAPSGIQFVLKGTDRTVNANWARDSGETAMKTALRKGTYKDLNLYFLSSIPGGILGYCYFPASATTSTVRLDGCTIASGTVPGGSISRFNLGKTAVHEVGHWFGLYHTFQGGCNGQGDLVDDTPAQASASSGCPIGRDSCPNQPGLDPIHNYMDYSDDSCYEEFTPGQNARMSSMFAQFRAGK
ncbi:hypothetical protein MCOR27_007509 [Pyricularia oryzae]|uniref:Extracellular metalloprotease MGG_08041 n=5 Tax=Pyricularia TaxID=48558 RepID=MEP1_PYRO7|nr:metalloprotease 1 [Pyricularia oryzae 70-15]A4RGT4.1 RecName: Full=Extracellular metalloprotease MGG_08041; Flags: Precursor [Pyricularia oryzae 70-15]ELQ39620.1 ulilysin [Pyricularia oryzae Y34]KAH8839394.1 hypothetical protein MCOR01_008597 [Pyricularia oryzae]KAI6304007.1 hypothetical protein MCOR33_000987 [Pyricularia grisea]EHA55186.1 metalloprotease 1 [Pyricularia oryzae 70-15]KAH9439243.1 hypothetical protein MCOR02_002809 [Pyricularia oryzae]